jgi:molybdopterin converting factor small subunit
VVIDVLIPGLLRSYTDGAAKVALTVGPSHEERNVPSIADALDALDARYPGLRFRIVDEQGKLRRHIRLFVDLAEARELATPLAAGQTLMIVGALSGG